MIKGACHCGAVTFEVAKTPQRIVSCNCSICRRYAALWVHAPPNEGVTLNAPEGATHTYSWGDKDLLFHACKSCNCITHWSGTQNERFAVNFRLVAPEDYQGVPIRHFDGADSWEFLD